MTPLGTGWSSTLACLVPDARSATKESIVEVRGSLYMVNGGLMFISDSITSYLHTNFGHAPRYIVITKVEQQIRGVVLKFVM